MPRRPNTAAPLASPPREVPADAPFTCPGCSTASTRWAIGQCPTCGNCSTCCGCYQARARMGLPYVEWPSGAQDLTFWGTPDAVIPRYFGVEVECGLDRFTGPVVPFLREWDAAMGSDGSVGNPERLGRAPTPPGYRPVSRAQACEIRTPPASGEAARTLLRGLGLVLANQGAHVDSTCGLHVHVDARGATADDLARLALLWSKIEPALWNAVAPSRRRVRAINQYCEAWGETFDRTGVLNPALTTSEKESAIRGVATKYRTLNFLPFWSQGTVEVRMHHGSVNGRKILRWATCMTQIVHYAFSQTDDVVRSLRGTPSEILDRCLDREHARWMRARREVFAAMRSRTGQPPRRPVRPEAPAPLPAPEPEAGDGSEV